MTEYGVLFSHAPELTVTLVPSRLAAAELASVVCSAQPGVEAEIMHRAAGGPWLSDTGKSLTEVARARWPLS